MRRSLPSLNALRAFEVAARHASFRAAGKELCVSHSAISHQVKLLEQYLGLELFTRNPRTVELTEAGGALYPVLRDAFDKIADCTDMLLAPRQQNVLTVRLYSTLAVRWLIPRLPKFQMAHPEIKFRLNSSQWDVDFDREAVDCCIMIGHRSNEALHYDYLFSSELFPVCSPELREAPFPLNEPDDLARCTILQVYPSCRDWRFWLERWQIDNVDPDSGLQFDSYDHALATARAGLGVAMECSPTSRRICMPDAWWRFFPARGCFMTGNGTSRAGRKGPASTKSPLFGTGCSTRFPPIPISRILRTGPYFAGSLKLQSLMMLSPPGAPTTA